MPQRGFLGGYTAAAERPRLGVPDAGQQYGGLRDNLIEGKGLEL